MTALEQFLGDHPGLAERSYGEAMRRHLVGHNHGFRVLGGVPRRGIYDNIWTSPAQRDLLGSAAGMHESIRPVAGRFAPLALMGVRCF